MAGSRPSDAKRPPGAPIGKDEIDPELVSLRGPRAKVGALAAFSILAVCVIYLVRLAGDFGFSRESEKPTDVTIADAIAGNASTDALVQISAPVERGSAVRVRTGSGDPGVRLAPVVGSGDKLWIALPGDPWLPTVDGRYRGRLHKASSGPMGAALRDYLETPQPRFVAGAELQRARLASADHGELKTVDGQAITAAADTQVEVDVTDPGAALVVTTYIERLKDAKAWGDALAAAGVIAPGTAATTTGKEIAAWVVHTPDAVATINAKLEKAELWATRVDPMTVSQKTTWRQLAITPDGLTISGAKLPWSAVDVAALWLPRPLPDGAYILVADEKPSDYRLVKPLYVMLAVLGLLFAWALWRAVRRDLWPLPK